jgi:hypothetical protein
MWLRPSNALFVTAGPHRPRPPVPATRASSGVGYLAIPALREVVRTHPQAAGPRRELVAAYEDQDRHGEAVDLLLPAELRG